MFVKCLKDILKSILNKYFYKFIIYSYARNDNSLSITFDDGPSKGNTELILNILKDEEVNATFFVLGKHAAKYPEIIRRMHDEGHNIGIHGYDHLKASNVSLRSYVEGVSNTHKLVEEITNSNISKVFRPPYGDITLLTFLFLVFKGYKYVMWNYDSMDSFVSNKEELLKSLKECVPVDGSICLFHDDYERTADILSGLIKYWKQCGFNFKNTSGV